MATVTSLGVHRPSAIPYLIAEGILPPDPGEHLYRWQTIEASNPDVRKKEDEEELVSTDHCVVWSRAGVIQRIFRFDVEGEAVTQAIFARFSSTTDVHQLKTDPFQPSSAGITKIQPDVRQGSDGTNRPNTDSDMFTGSECQQRTIPERGTDTHFPLLKATITSDLVQERALVVTLKSQAHIFFVSGMSHVIHLPFEVESVFPLPQGILIQRKIPHLAVAAAPIVQTPHFPSAPHNSFANSQLSPHAVASSQLFSSQTTAHEPSEISSHVSLLYDGLQRRALRSRQTGAPRLYCLSDPVNEVGVAVTKSGDEGPNKRQRPVFDSVDPEEDLLYVSSNDELLGHSSDATLRMPLLLAVTLNRDTGFCTVWTIEHVQQNDMKSSAPVNLSRSSGVWARRRSSYMPGAGTGASTPNVWRTGSREVSGPLKSRNYSNRDTTTEDITVQPEMDLLHQLDPTLGDHTAPPKSSRRASSLLARADLSANYDNSTMPDLVGSHAAAAHHLRRPVGSSGIRLGSLDGHFNAPRATTKDTRASIESLNIYENGFEETIDDFADLDELRAFDDLTMVDSVAQLRKEVILKKIYGFPMTDRVAKPLSSETEDAARPKLFTLNTPDLSLTDDAKDATIYLCLVDYVAHCVIFLEVCTRLHINSKATHKKKSATTGNINPPSTDAYIGQFIKIPEVLDACVVKQGEYSRVLVLNDGSEISNQLSLQAPWSRLCRIHLPSNFNLHDPFLVSPSLLFRQNSEGSLRRIIQSPHQLRALQHCGNDGRVDVVDSGSVHHRIRIQLQPYNSLVRKMITVCNVMTSASWSRREGFLLAWWDVMSWLQSRPEAEADMEWSASVIALFSFAVRLVQDWKTEPAGRQKRRKGALLRSSSGANTDLESWEEMLSHESGASGTVPPWMHDSAWKWAIQNISPNAEEQPRKSTKLRSTRPSMAQALPQLPQGKKSSSILRYAALAREFTKSYEGLRAQARQSANSTAFFQDSGTEADLLVKMLLGLHILREELKLNILSARAVHALAPVLAQLGGWLGWKSWGFHDQAFYSFESHDLQHYLFNESVIVKPRMSLMAPFEPPSILQYVENAYLEPPASSFTTLVDVMRINDEVTSQGNGEVEHSRRTLMKLTPRSMMLNRLLTLDTKTSLDEWITELVSWTNGLSMLETLPEGIAALCRAAVSRYQQQPSARCDSRILQMIGRDDLTSLGTGEKSAQPNSNITSGKHGDSSRDVHSLCSSALEVENIGAYDWYAESDRQSVTRMIFKNDRRFFEAVKLLQPLQAPTAQCAAQPDWSDTDLLEAQQELVKTIAVRTLSVSSGRGLLFYSARFPLLTEKFPIHGFTLSCIMKPTNTTITADRNLYTEDKVSWAFFHAGVEAGLSISKHAKGINTSWILFNKPPELKNRHAGFLFGIGLNGHLQSLAKWVAFKYLTPKHPMTSIGLLLGLSASYLGTMDSLITRLLSVHVTRMLPPGAAELNLSPLTQTGGIMGIGLLYFNTQHRRMSEIMLSEIENVNCDDDAHPLESLRDEGYRLAAGFALGYINLGGGQDLKGLHDTRVVDRLLALAIGTKKVRLVHILDKATAAAVISVALIFMKTHDAALARKIDIPDTVHQFDYVRPDIFLLRTVARHLIMWNEIQPNSAWIRERLPQSYQHKAKLTTIRTLNSEELPFFNVIAGLCLSIGLRFAGTGSFDARNILCHYLDQLIRICRLPATNYDNKLTRLTTRNCQDTVALSAACVMAGTGDLQVFRRLRSLHGRTDPDTPYGSHLAAHMAIGVLFLGGGTHTFGTSNLAVASLFCAFYPLFPATVLDNQSHLQAFRHFWALAVEPRCLVVRDVDTHRPVSTPLLVRLHDGSELAMSAPCLLPDLKEIERIQTTDPEYWRVTLDLVANRDHLLAFQRDQSIYVRRRAGYDSNTSVFSSTLRSLDDSQMSHQFSAQAFEWIFNLPVFDGYDPSERSLVLAGDAGGITRRDLRGTVIDDRLVLEKTRMDTWWCEQLWNLRLLFAWADRLGLRGEEWAWLREDMVKRLRAKLSVGLEQ
ncbi:MAG: hypothetical protein LQ351_004546 [Letrouitia transgressa]|nr:MAG: hypothetical protein LQ351_004546 [Letrouitia transgressa]